jgi:hypothetical protein
LSDGFDLICLKVEFHYYIHLFNNFNIMDKYILLFRNTPKSEAEYQNLSPEAMQAELDKWGQWIGGIAAQGKLVGTDPLHNHGKVVSKAGQVVTDGPFVEGKELVSGYLVMTADSPEEVVEFSKGCPILEIDGSVEIRPLMVF